MLKLMLTALSVTLVNTIVITVDALSERVVGARLCLLLCDVTHNLFNDTVGFHRRTAVAAESDFLIFCGVD